MLYMNVIETHVLLRLFVKYRLRDTAISVNYIEIASCFRLFLTRLDIVRTVCVTRNQQFYFWSLKMLKVETTKLSIFCKLGHY